MLGEDLEFVGETHTAVTIKQREHLLYLFNTALPSKLTSTTRLNEEDLGFVEEGGAVAVVKQQENLLQRNFFAVRSEHEPFLPVTQEADDAGIGTCVLRPGGKLPQLFHHSLFGWGVTYLSNTDSFCCCCFYTQSTEKRTTQTHTETQHPCTQSLKHNTPAASHWNNTLALSHWNTTPLHPVTETQHPCTQSLKHNTLALSHWNTTPLHSVTET